MEAEKREEKKREGARERARVNQPQTEHFKINDRWTVTERGRKGKTGTRQERNKKKI